MKHTIILPDLSQNRVSANDATFSIILYVSIYIIDAG